MRWPRALPPTPDAPYPRTILRTPTPRAFALVIATIRRRRASSTEGMPALMFRISIAGPSDISISEGEPDDLGKPEASPQRQGVDEVVPKGGRWSLVGSLGFRSQWPGSAGGRNDGSILRTSRGS